MQVSTRRHSRVELPGMQGQSILNLRQAHLGAWRVPSPQRALSRCSVGFQRQRDPWSSPRGSSRADGRQEARGASAGRRGGSHGAAGASKLQRHDGLLPGRSRCQRPEFREEHSRRFAMRRSSPRPRLARRTRALRTRRGRPQLRNLGEVIAVMHHPLWSLEGLKQELRRIRDPNGPRTT